MHVPDGRALYENDRVINPAQVSNPQVLYGLQKSIICWFLHVLMFYTMQYDMISYDMIMACYTMTLIMTRRIDNIAAL